MEISCSQIELSNSAVKCLKIGLKPRHLEVDGSKSQDFTIKKRDFGSHFSVLPPRAPLIRPVPKAGIFQVCLARVEPKLPYVARATGYRRKEKSLSF